MGVPDPQTYGDGYETTKPAKASSSGKKRKAVDPILSSPKRNTTSEVIDLTGDTPPKKRKKQPTSEEKRLRRWRSHPPLSYEEIRHRALTQRMFVLDRQRDISHVDHPVETISLAGTTGNIYSVAVDKVPSCDCPHATKGNQCKHIIYVLNRVLRVSSDLEYQLAFTSSELRDIFTQAPPLPSEQGDRTERDGNRKAIEGECPICCVDFEPKNTGEEIVYCKVACGNNVHKMCFQQWAATKKAGDVTCPFCREPWQGDGPNLKDAARSGKTNGDGYVNIATQLGISGQRDYSSYHQHWVRRQIGYDYH